MALSSRTLAPRTATIAAPAAASKPASKPTPNKPVAAPTPASKPTPNKPVAAASTGTPSKPAANKPVATAAAPTADPAYAALAKQLSEMHAKLESVTKAVGNAKGARDDGTRSLESLISKPPQDIPEGDWRREMHGVIATIWRFGFKDPKNPSTDGFYLLDGDATVRALLVVPRDADPGNLGPHERMGGRIAVYTAFLEDGEHVRGQPFYLVEEEINQALCRDDSGDASPYCDTTMRERYISA